MSPPCSLYLFVFQISSFDSLIKKIDHCTGVAKCRDVITRLDYLHDDQVRTIFLSTCAYQDATYVHHVDYNVHVCNTCRKITHIKVFQNDIVSAHTYTPPP